MVAVQSETVWGDKKVRFSEGQVMAERLDIVGLAIIPISICSTLQ